MVDKVKGEKKEDVSILTHPHKTTEHLYKHCESIKIMLQKAVADVAEAYLCISFLA